MYRRNIVHPRVKCRSRSVTMDDSGLSASWQICVWSLISLEALVFEKLMPTIQESGSYVTPAC